ncbi:hypothetical protein AQUCO_01000703v1 [Aquilegia coerulea]|uniref:C2H2-type domain-containing protein n=1 Tax=Aquilegia coerulea TaxID=218851 RepID=A0A2G5EB99_AQUCA|nr:hypothetical protein AQUCO_01000703v1 [Aquilegia coerulea]
MKRSRENTENLTTMANCLMMLSQGGNRIDSISHSSSRVFECRTCNRQFQSFQALGGHRASHKKPRQIEEEDLSDRKGQILITSSKKVHECSICGLEFTVGQALGGHMRRHRATASDQSSCVSSVPTPQVVPLFNRSNSKRILCLDLNLTPLENDDLEYPIRNRVPERIQSPMIYCFI